MDYYDVIIVGAGPAGSTLARALEGAGKQVLIIDKAEFPRDKTCAGWVTPAVLASLDIDANEYGNGRTLQPIRRFRIGMMGQDAVENNHGERSEEHTSELQSRPHLVCRRLLDKNKYGLDVLRGAHERP